MMKKLLTASVVAASVAGMNVTAQQLEEVLVTAQKREQGANDVGITMNAFTGEMLKDAGFSTAEDIEPYSRFDN